jgi:hypothetical protein
MTQFSFGSGTLYGVRSDLANATPAKFGALQDIQIDFTFQTRELYGQNQFPLTIARGQGKITGKAKFAQVNGALFNNLFFGQTLATGGVVNIPSEPWAVPASNPYQVTATNGATFVTDLGVTYATTGLALTKVASAPAAGQYAVSTSGGIYTFAAGDAGASVLIAYTYTSSGGNRTAIANQVMGSGPTFQAVFTETFNGKPLSLTLNACVASKLSLATKNDNFTIPELDFSAYGDASQNIGTISFGE